MSLFQSNLRKQIRNLPKILNFQFCENYSLLFKIIHWCPYSFGGRANDARFNDAAESGPFKVVVLDHGQQVPTRTKRGSWGARRPPPATTAEASGGASNVKSVPRELTVQGKGTYATSSAPRAHMVHRRESQLAFPQSPATM